MATDTIADADAMLSLLRADPAERAVLCLDSDDDNFGKSCIAEVSAKFLPLRVLAWLTDDGSAKILCDAAVDAALKAADGDTVASRSLPLVYGPHCGTWVLPEHPAAFTDGPAAS
jgi:hypothetical protein